MTLALGPFESQLVLLPLLLIVIIGLFALVITDLEVVLRRRLREDLDGEEIGATILSFPKARGRRRRGRRRQPGSDPNDLQRALLQRARDEVEELG